jgi:hypothetical protein
VLGLPGADHIPEVADFALQGVAIEKQERVKAWFCVEALTFSLIARWLRKALISGSAIVTGWRTWWKKMNRLTQWQ